MPSSGKDRLIPLFDGQASGKIVTTPEAWTKIHEIGMVPTPHPGYDYLELAKATIKEEMRARERLMYRGHYHYGVLLKNRSFNDSLPFIMAKMIAGQIPIELYLHNPQVFNIVAEEDATIILLVTPEIALARKGPSAIGGNILNSEFLKVLYGQYLRFYQGLREVGHPNVAVLDMTGSLEESFEKLRQTVEEIIGEELVFGLFEKIKRAEE